MRIAALLAVFAAALVASVAHPVPAYSATPCWKALLNDWYDGRIDNAYPIRCYADALKHLPPDVQTYSSAHDDIERALQSARARLRRAGTAVTPNTEVPPSTSKTPTGTTSTTTTTPLGPNASPGRKPGKGLSNLADKLNPSSPSSLPLPLLILGALALLLVAAGGVGLVLKRQQGRNSAS